MYRFAWTTRSATFIAVLLLTLNGCAVHPRPRARHVETHLTPQDVLAHPRATREARIRWGGMVIDDNVGPVHSTLTILAYPLNRRGRPRLQRSSWGRFQAQAPGYLDPAVFAQGRLVTVVGLVAGTKKGLIGQAPYVYPRVRILETHIWRFYRRRRRSHWTFGFGVGLGM